MSPPSSPLVPDERLAAGAARFATRFAGRFAPETVLGLLADSYTRLAEQARIRTHVVVLAERLTADRLHALAHRAGERVTVSSVGIEPAGEVAPHIAQALTEAGVELADAYPKPLSEEVVQAADIVMTMGCGDACPVVPGRRSLDRPVADPDGAPISVVRDIRDIRDDLDARITEVLTQLAP